ncbi:hypothetical protein ACROYT_G016923 [Oculina patagonica]
MHNLILWSSSAAEWHIKLCGLNLRFFEGRRRKTTLEALHRKSNLTHSEFNFSMNSTAVSTTHGPSTSAFNQDPGMEMYEVIILLVFYSIVCLAILSVNYLIVRAFWTTRSSTSSSTLLPRLPGLCRPYGGTGVYTNLPIQHVSLAQYWLLYL